MWECTDNQDVGLEAAIIERKRNSSLVKRSCAENVTGLKCITEAADGTQDFGPEVVVGEHSMCGEVRRERRMERMEELMQA